MIHIQLISGNFPKLHELAMMKTTSKFTNQCVSKFLYLSEDERRACLSNTLCN